MANYVYNKVVCTKNVLEKYFIDYKPFSDDESLVKPYISFNRIFNTKIDDEYSNKYGAHIYYGCGFDYREISDCIFEIKFNTLWNYPIKAIVAIIKLCKNDIIWYVIEENCIYFSKFYWQNNKVLEDTLNVETDDFKNWSQHEEENLNRTPDYWVWDYRPDDKSEWKNWKCEDLIKKYFDDYPINLYYEEMKNK